MKEKGEDDREKKKKRWIGTKNQLVINVFWRILFDHKTRCLLRFCTLQYIWSLSLGNASHQRLVFISCYITNELEFDKGENRRAII